MNRRDYFAAQALNGLLARGRLGDDATLARNAYELADAMIARSPPNAQALLGSGYAIAQSVEGYLLSEPTIANAWRGLGDDTRARIIRGFADVAQRELLRYFKSETT
jgi:hypothetical protein